MNLREWHDNLNSHFADLHKLRANDNCSVFVFEHNLNSEKRDELKQSIHEHLATSTPDERHWLPWIVYATEIGYEFDGHNFWSPFQEKTSNWTIHDRPFIRDSFKKFVKSFGGFKPSDIWAKHFNIICYPITHAILPRDLQRQLAKILYDLRFQLRSFLQSTEQLGIKILSRSDGTSKRFQQFSQNTELTGLIARELLSHDEIEDGNIILPSTLKRIVGDLRQQRDAASWLDDARTFSKKSASRNFRIRIEGDKSQRVRLEPRLVLRPLKSTRWDLFIEFPDLQPLAEQSTELSEFLTSSRPRINGSFYDKRLARGNLVSYGAIREKLKTLPDETQPLLIFRREKPSALDKFLKDEFRLKTQIINLFKVHNDGLAYKQNSFSVCPGNCYLVLSRNTIPINSLVSKQTVSCDDVHLYLLSLPKTISSKEESFLNTLGFKIKLGAVVTPVGTAPAVWDEETYIEFLADEDPCLAVELDHEVQSLLFEYGKDKLEICDADLQNPIFINLPQLSIGSYDFIISEKQHNQNDYEILANVEISIREPRSQQSATTSQNALLLFTDPFRPTFEQLFTEKVKFDFWTPPDTIVNVYLTLLRKKEGDNNKLLKKKLFTSSLPNDSSKLNTNIFESLQDDRIQGKLEDAYSCLLEFESGELGTVPVNFEREFLPLKWNVKVNKNQIFLRLSDYSDSDEKVSIVKYDFLTPDKKIIVPYNEVHELGFPIPSSGGLYIAENSQIKQGIVILRPLEQSSFKSFSDLRQEDGFIPKFLKYKRISNSLSELLRLYIVWATSVSVGSVLRKTDINIVSNGLLLEIISLIDDGFGWRKAEVQFCAGKNTDSFYLRKAVSSNPSLLEKLAKFCAAPRFFSADEWVDNLVSVLGDEVPEERTKVQRIGKISHIKITRRDWFAEFALRLCSSPETLPTWADKRYELGLEKMLAHPTLVRAARYIVVTVNRKTLNGYKNLPYTWDWE